MIPKLKTPTRERSMSPARWRRTLHLPNKGIRQSRLEPPPDAAMLTYLSLPVSA